jgi:hypothetical protein
MATDGTVTDPPALPSVRRKALVAYAVVLLNGAGLVAWGLVQSNWSGPAMVLGAVAIIAAGAYGLTLRCPRCGTPISKRKAKVMGVDVSYWGGFTVPRTCSKCGLDLP